MGVLLCLMIRTNLRLQAIGLPRITWIHHEGTDMALTVDDLFASWMDRTIKQAQEASRLNENQQGVTTDKLRLLFAG